MKKSRRPKLLILAGVNGVGKSTLSMEIANNLKIKRVVSTDSIREVLRSNIDSLESPELHRSTFSVGRHKHPIYDCEDCSDILSNGINAIIDKSRREGVDLVLEGVHIKPDNEIIRKSSIALGGVDEKIITLTKIENYLIDKNVNSNLSGFAESDILNAINPVSDNHSSTNYKKHLSKILVKKVINDAKNKISINKRW